MKRRRFKEYVEKRLSEDMQTPGEQQQKAQIMQKSNKVMQDIKSGILKGDNALKAIEKIKTDKAQTDLNQMKNKVLGNELQQATQMMKKQKK